MTVPEGYRLSRDRGDVDLDRVHRWLSEQAYWALGRSRDAVERSVAGSRCWSVLGQDGGEGDVQDGGQVAFARAVTDGTTFAWLCDVFVDLEHRGVGIGTWLVQQVVTDLVGDGVPRVVLATRDAHEVYRRIGFEPLVVPERWMEIDRRPPSVVARGMRPPS